MTDTPYTKSLIEAIYLRYQREALALEAEYQVSADGDVLTRILELKTLCLKLSFKLSQIEDVGAWITQSKPRGQPLMTKREQAIAHELNYPGFDAKRMRQLTESSTDELEPTARIRRLH